MVGGGEGFSLYVADFRQDTVAVGAFGCGVASRVMHRVAEYVLRQAGCERYQVNETLCGFGAEGIGYSVWRIDGGGQDVQGIDDVMG
jgi:hypothetical protein